MCGIIGLLARNDEDVERAAETLRFPLFVKHYSSYASVDISRRSRVVTPAGLRIQARKIISRHGAALIEEYIDGIECTVLVAENPDDPEHPTTYTPAQYRFPEGESFKHSDLKWVDYDGLSSFAVPDPVLAQKLRSTRKARPTCWNSIPTAASTTPRRIGVAPISVFRSIQPVMRVSPDNWWLQHSLVTPGASLNRRNRWKKGLRPVDRRPFLVR